VEPSAATTPPPQPPTAQQASVGQIGAPPPTPPQVGNIREGWKLIAQGKWQKIGGSKKLLIKEFRRMFKSNPKEAKKKLRFYMKQIKNLIK